MTDGLFEDYPWPPPPDGGADAAGLVAELRRLRDEIEETREALARRVGLLLLLLVGLLAGLVLGCYLLVRTHDMLDGLARAKFQITLPAGVRPPARTRHTLPPAEPAPRPATPEGE